MRRITSLIFLLCLTLPMMAVGYYAVNIDWKQVSTTVNTLDVKAINQAVNDLDVVELNEKLAAIDVDELNKSLENLNAAAETLKKLSVLFNR